MERQAIDERARRNLAELASAEANATAAAEAVRAFETESAKLDQMDAEVRASLSVAGLAQDADLTAIAQERAQSASAVARLQSVSNKLQDVMAGIRYLVSEDRRSRLREEADRLNDQRMAVQAEVERDAVALGTLRGITAAAKSSELDLVRRLMRDQQPLLNALYRRLRPHPVMDEIDVDFGEFRERGEVYFQAVAGARRANVSAIFSSAQLNAVAICIFLALNLSSTRSTFALLDDPIQNMDDFNVLGLLDLLRSVSEGRQLIISTHDAQLGELMRRKLRPLRPSRQTIRHEFVGYDEAGPQVATTRDGFEEAPQVLETIAR